MFDRIDSEVGAFINGNFSEVPEVSDATDPFEKFLANAQLAGELGHDGWNHVARLNEETAEYHKRADAIMRGPRATPDEILRKATAPTAADDLDESLIDDTRKLAKRFDKRTPAPGARFEKSQNGRWMFEFGPDGEIVGGREIEA